MNRFSSTSKWIILIGGCQLSSEREPIKSIERINVEEIGIHDVRVISENCGELELPRRSPACFLTKNREILVVGGCLGPNNHSNSMEILQKCSKNDEKFKFGAKILSEKLEIGSSCSAFDPETSTKFKPIFGGFEAHSCLDDVQVLEFSENLENFENFSVKTRKIPVTKLPKIKNSTVLEVKNGEFLMFGGWEDEQRTSRAIRRIIFNEDFTDFEVNFEGFLPYSVEGHSMTKIGSEVYLIGGFDGFSVIDTIIRYSMETRKSEILDVKLSEKRENHVSGVIGDKFLVIAGGWNSRESLKSVEIFEIGANFLVKCKVEGNLNFARNRPAAVVF